VSKIIKIQCGWTKLLQKKLGAYFGLTVWFAQSLNFNTTYSIFDSLDKIF